MHVEEKIVEIEQSIESIVREAMQCKLDVYNKMEETSKELKRHSEIRALNQQKLENNQRKLEDKVDALHKGHKEFKDILADHTKDEMSNMVKMTEAIERLSTTVDKVIESVEKVVTETRENTISINEQKKQEEIDLAVADALKEAHKPMKGYVKHAVNVAVGAFVLALLGGLWKLTVFISTLSSTPQGGV